MIIEHKELIKQMRSQVAVSWVLIDKAKDLQRDYYALQKAALIRKQQKVREAEAKQAYHKPWWKLAKPILKNGELICWRN